MLKSYASHAAHIDIGCSHCPARQMFTCITKGDVVHIRLLLRDLARCGIEARYPSANVPVTDMPELCPEMPGLCQTHVNLVTRSPMLEPLTMGPLPS